MINKKYIIHKNFRYIKYRENFFLSLLKNRKNDSELGMATAIQKDGGLNIIFNAMTIPINCQLCKTDNIFHTLLIRSNRVLIMFWWTSARLLMSLIQYLSGAIGF